MEVAQGDSWVEIRNGNGLTCLRADLSGTARMSWVQVPVNAFARLLAIPSPAGAPKTVPCGRLYGRWRPPCTLGSSMTSHRLLADSASPGHLRNRGTVVAAGVAQGTGSDVRLLARRCVRLGTCP